MLKTYGPILIDEIDKAKDVKKYMRSLNYLICFDRYMYDISESRPKAWKVWQGFRYNEKLSYFVGKDPYDLTFEEVLTLLEQDADEFDLPFEELIQFLE
jgi:hypothetical protein